MGLRVLLLLAPILATLAGGQTAPDPATDEITGLRLSNLLAVEARRRHGPDAKETLRAIAACEQAFRLALNRFPENPDVLAAYGSFCAETGQHDLAKDAWERALGRAPGQPEAATGLGGYHLARGEILPAADYFAMAATQSHAQAKPHFDLANLLFLFRHEIAAAQKRSAGEVMGAALDHFRKARDLDPLNPEYATAYAESYYILDPPRWNEARAAWEAALNITPEKEYIYLHLARVALRQKDRPSALRFLSRVTDPKRQNMAAKLRDMAEKLPPEKRP